MVAAAELWPLIERGVHVVNRAGKPLRGQMRSLGLLDTVVPLNATAASFDLRGTVPAGAPIVAKSAQSRAFW
jgi:hypothetical protein